MRLIDADALKDCVEKSIAEFGGLYSEDLKTGLRMCVYIAEQQPERIRGMWGRTVASPTLIVCNRCGRTVLKNGSVHWNFCPTCGAEMEVSE